MVLVKLLLTCLSPEGSPLCPHWPAQVTALALRLPHGTVGVSVVPEGAAMETFSWGSKRSAISIHGFTPVRLGCGFLV